MDSNRDGKDEWSEEQWEDWLTRDIGLDEFEDEDFSEITEISDEYVFRARRNHSDIRHDHVTEAGSSALDQLEAGAAAGRIQTETQPSHLSEALHWSHRVRESKASMDSTLSASMDGHRPKRPTTLNLFPTLVPRTQDTLNNNSFAKKFSWQQKISQTMPPGKPGVLTPSCEHTCLSDEEKHQPSRPQIKDRGTCTDKPDLICPSRIICPSQAPSKPREIHKGQENCEHTRYHTDIQVEPTEEIYLTPIRRSVEINESEKRQIILNSTESEAPPPYSEQDLQPPSYFSCVEACQVIDGDVNDAEDLCFRDSAAGEACSHQESVSKIILNASLSPSDTSQMTHTALINSEDVDETDELCFRDCGAGEAQSNHESLSLHLTNLDVRKGIKNASLSPSDASGLSYDSVKYTLVVDEHDQLELVSLRDCFHGYSDESDSGTIYDNCESSPYESAIEKESEEDDKKEIGEKGNLIIASESFSEDSTPETNSQFSRKFVNVFMNGCSRSSSTESFGLFSCVINGEERDQTHKAVYRFLPRHEDELELELNDPLLVEIQHEDFWFEGYNMRTRSRGIFPAYYATEVYREKEIKASIECSEWMEKYRMKFLGSVQVMNHKGSDVLCAAMHKVAMSRRLTVHYDPPSTCELEITVKGLKLTVKEQFHANSEYSHFFHLKNVSFCGYHPQNKKYFGFITKHPADQRFACHVFVSEMSTKPLAESVRKAFHLYYKEFVEVSCPTEDIYLE
ncbi:hypothetical protein DNTS_002650 [Danionella cerebrum]|uniref:SH3 domain-containing protein n=1 Tax=Danionella cerebrum TaxID=2873325 RepID=A0A553QKK3_9TELE|nr:hypothetical protein DNTS_002650 [Danionella translucida]